MDEMNTEAAGIEAQIAISVVDQDPHMIEVGDIEVGALGQGIRMTNQTCRYLEEIQQTCQMFNWSSWTRLTGKERPILS